MTIYRIRTIDIDGNKLGRVWGENLFMEKDRAVRSEEITRMNPTYKIDIVEGLSGYCDWNRGIMICYDSVDVK
jgi:hypothetical protein